MPSQDESEAKEDILRRCRSAMVVRSIQPQDNAVASPMGEDNSGVISPRRSQSTIMLMDSSTETGDRSDLNLSLRRYKMRRSILQSFFFPHYSHKDVYAAKDQERVDQLKAEGKTEDEIREEIKPGLRAKFVNLIHTKTVQTVLLLMLILDVALVITEILLLSHKEASVEVFESHHVDPYTNHTTICGPENFTYHRSVTLTVLNEISSSVHDGGSHHSGSDDLALVNWTRQHGLVVDPGCFFTVLQELPPGLALTHTIIGWVSFSILVIFAIELIGLFICLLKDFFTPMYVFDSVIIFVSILLHFLLAKEKNVGAELIIFFRCWRFARILHGVGLTVHDSDEKAAVEGKEAVEELAKTKQELEELKKAMAKLTAGTTEGKTKSDSSLTIATSRNDSDSIITTTTGTPAKTTTGVTSPRRPLLGPTTAGVPVSTEPVPS